MLIPDVTEITYRQFVDVVQNQQCGTLSRCYRPLTGEVAWTGSCDYDQFLELPVFPVWYLGPTGGDYDHWDHTLYPDYRRILLRDAVHLDDYLHHVKAVHQELPPQNRPLHVILLHCRACGHAAIIDGNHRLTARARGTFRGADPNRVVMTGLSGLAWPATMHDMNKVCACLCPAE